MSSISQSKKTIKAWVGFVDGKLDWYGAQEYYRGVVHANLFKSRKAAKKCYDDVRRVEIVVVKEQPK
jgi:hypothetical protein